jgi:hypothetical protein
MSREIGEIPHAPIVASARSLRDQRGIARPHQCNRVNRPNTTTKAANQAASSSTHTTIFHRRSSGRGGRRRFSGVYLPVPFPDDAFAVPFHRTILIEAGPPMDSEEHITT